MPALDNVSNSKGIGLEKSNVQSIQVCAPKNRPVFIHILSKWETYWLGQSNKQIQPINTLFLEHEREGCNLIGCRAQISSTFRQNHIFRFQ